MAMICIGHTYLECIIPERNRKAYYRLMAGQDPFGLKLIRSWGRIGAKERIRIQERFSSQKEILKAYDRILNLRLSHGYVVKARRGSARVDDKQYKVKLEP